MLIEKEVFDKYVKLISAGIIQTSAKNIHSLTLDEILNLPISGTQLINLKLVDSVGTIKFIDSTILGTNTNNIDIFDMNNLEFSKEKTQELTIESKFKSFMVIILTILKNSLDVIDKKETNFSFYLSLKNCYLIKNKCIIDTFRVSNDYCINFGENKKDSILNIENLNNETNLKLFLNYIYDLIKQNYIDDITNSEYIKYKFLKSVKDEIPILLNEVGKTDEINKAITDEWFNDILSDILLYIDFEFSVTDSMPSVGITEILYSEIFNPTSTQPNPIV